MSMKRLTGLVRSPKRSNAEIDAMPQAQEDIHFLTQEEFAAMEQAERPAVQKGCICPNNHQAKDGYVITSPSCQIHGCKSRYVERLGQVGFDARTVGVIHGTGGDR